MRIDNWKTFHESLVIEPPYGEAVPMPSVAKLDEFEKRAGLRLPRGYREYILEFGPGTLMEEWEVGAPGYTKLAKEWNLERVHSALRSFAVEMVDDDRFRRCFYFCRKYKDIYGWDPAEVCNVDVYEYAIYRIMEGGNVIRAAESFREFVEGAVDYMLSLDDWDEEELGPRLTFRPASLDVKQPPPNSETPD